MFFCMSLAAKDKRTFAGHTFDLVAYRVDEDGHLRGYISSGGYSERIIEMPGETARDIRTVTGSDPVEALISVMKDEIDAGKFQLPSST